MAMKQLYQIDGGRYTLNINWDEYRQIMYELTIPEQVVFNPFINLIKSSYTFNHDGNTIVVRMTNHSGKGLVNISCDDINIMDLVIDDLYGHYKFQIEYWNMFGIPLVFHLKDNKVINDENIDYYSSVLFFPPILSGRTEWDVVEIMEDYYIHKMDDEWCLYHWVSGQEEECMNLYVTGDDIDMVKDKFRTILDEMGVKPVDKTTKWSDVIYNEDGTITLTKCG